MNFSETIANLNKASAFELYRLRAAIDRVLDQPDWMIAVRSRLRVGQVIQYFDPVANRSEQGQLLELRRKQAVVLELSMPAGLIPFLLTLACGSHSSDPWSYLMHPVTTWRCASSP